MSEIDIQQKQDMEGVEKKPEEKVESEKKILKKKSTKITEETIELTDPKAVAEALGLNEKISQELIDTTKTHN